jgi:hypothetical protein
MGGASIRPGGMLKPQTTFQIGKSPANAMSYILLTSKLDGIGGTKIMGGIYV